uniref:Uncharacterized protein n=1 Tax=Anguilla anguilla TaxID=7936 RepID=A0A0E9X9F0_ANGAN
MTVHGGQEFYKCDILMWFQTKCIMGPLDPNQTQLFLFPLSLVYRISITLCSSILFVV